MHSFKKMLPVVWLALSIATIPFAYADKGGTPGLDLMKSCEMVIDRTVAEAAPAQVLLAGECIGLVEGVRDTAFLMGEVNGGKSMLCGPSGAFISTDQSLRVVVKYLQNNPEKLYLEKTKLVMLALLSAFPCE